MNEIRFFLLRKVIKNHQIKMEEVSEIRKGDFALALSLISLAVAVATLIMKVAK